MIDPSGDSLERVRAFHQLHQSGCFVMPNPWDAGSARLLEQLGFAALATTSSGFAWSCGRADNRLSLQEALAHFRLMTSTVALPVNGDFEGAFAVEPEGVFANVTLAAGTGLAGLSVEDSSGNASQPLFEFELAVERIRAARSAIDASGTTVVLTARSEGFIVGRPDLSETLKRRTAYAEAGADCLYAPGIRSVDEITAVVQGVAPRPVNVLVGSSFTSVQQLAALGVRRISLGGALARAAWTGFVQAARELATSGSFTALDGAIPFAEVDAFFADE